MIFCTELCGTSPSGTVKQRELKFHQELPVSDLQINQCARYSNLALCKFLEKNESVRFSSSILDLRIWRRT